MPTSKQTKAKTKEQTRKLPLWLGWVILLGAIIFTTVLIWQTQLHLTPTTDTTLLATPTPTPEPPKPITLLLMGYGGGGHEGGRLTDTMMVTRIDTIAKTLTLISIPRDLWVPLPLTSEQTTWRKINAAYAIGEGELGFKDRDSAFQGEHGGGTLAKTVASAITGFTPDYYATVDFATFIKGIDTVGPLTVQVPYSFTDLYYPITGKENDPCNFTESDIATLTATLKGFELEKQFGCRYEQITFEEGPTTMDGETALKFVRSRHSGTGGGDFGRTQRQQALLQAVLEKVFSLSFLPKVAPLAQQLAGSIKTDLPIARLPEMMAVTGNLSEYTIIPVTLTDANVLTNGRSADKQYILRPKTGDADWASIHTFINQEIERATMSASLDEQATPSASPVL